MQKCLLHEVRRDFGATVAAGEIRAQVLAAFADDAFEVCCFWRVFFHPMSPDGSGLILYVSADGWKVHLKRKISETSLVSRASFGNFGSTNIHAIYQWYFETAQDKAYWRFASERVAHGSDGVRW